MDAPTSSPVAVVTGGARGIGLAIGQWFLRHGYRVVLTRSTDEFLALRERVARARAWKADLFLSVHADALPDTEMRGLSVFTLSAQASDREAAALKGLEQRIDDLVVHRAPMLGVRMQHQGDRRIRLLAVLVPALDPPLGAIDNHIRHL